MVGAERYNKATWKRLGLAGAESVRVARVLRLNVQHLWEGRYKATWTREFGADRVRVARALRLLGRVTLTSSRWKPSTLADTLTSRR